MDESWIDRWNERYRGKEFAYGTDPNRYLKEQLDQLLPGTILFPAEGEGRNAVYAAQQGWKVSAFDISDAGKAKAMRLASSHKVTIDYQVGDLTRLKYSKDQFDVIALIYAHFPAKVKSSIHHTLHHYLRNGGFVIFEAFSKRHIQYNSLNEKVGGPKDLAMLFSTDEITADFPNFEVVELVEKEIELSEGAFHNGTGSVIRFMGRKK